MRRRRPVRREVLPDPKYNSKLVSKFISCMMYDGKKGVSETNFYRAMEIIGQKTQKDAVEVFIQKDSCCVITNAQKNIKNQTTKNLFKRSEKEEFFMLIFLFLVFFLCNVSFITAKVLNKDT